MAPFRLCLLKQTDDMLITARDKKMIVNCAEQIQKYFRLGKFIPDDDGIKMNNNRISRHIEGRYLSYDVSEYHQNLQEHQLPTHRPKTTRRPSKQLRVRMVSINSWQTDLERIVW